MEIYSLKLKLFKSRMLFSLRTLEVLWIVKYMMLLDCGPEILENGYNMGTLTQLGSIV